MEGAFFQYPDGTMETEIYKIGTENPLPDFQIGTVFEDIGTGIVSTVEAVAAAPGKVYDKVSSTVRNAWLYTVGGVLLVGILAIVLLGAGTKFTSSVQGLK